MTINLVQKMQRKEVIPIFLLKMRYFQVGKYIIRNFGVQVYGTI